MLKSVEFIETIINLHTVIYPTADLVECLNWNI